MPNRPDAGDPETHRVKVVSVIGCSDKAGNYAKDGHLPMRTARQGALWKDPDFHPPVNPMPANLTPAFFWALAVDRDLLSLAEALESSAALRGGWASGVDPRLRFSGDVSTGCCECAIPLRELSRVSSYSFIHLGFTHCDLAWRAAAGAWQDVGRGQWAGAFLAILCRRASLAVLYALVADDPVWLVGA